MNIIINTEYNQLNGIEFGVIDSIIIRKIYGGEQA